MGAAGARYRALDADAIVETCRRLATRIHERFPQAGLRGVADELLGLAQESAQRIEHIRRPRWPIRIGVVALSLLVLAGAAGLIAGWHDNTGQEADIPLMTLPQGIESGVNDIVFLGIAVYFLATLEKRIKRRAALRALHELRSMAHVIDMHQLTKDPEQLLSPAMSTASSPERTMTRFELARYLDYCSEMLSITSKVAALYVQHIDAPLVLGAVNDIQGLTGGLSAKIWQKIVIIDTIAVRQHAQNSAAIALP